MLLIITIITSMGGIIVYQKNKLKENKIEIERLDNNWKSQVQINQSKNKNYARILKLKIEEFKNSEDSIINTLNITRNKLGIKDKQLKQAQGIISQFNDTSKITVPLNKDSNNIIVNCDFEKEIIKNSETYIKISRKDTILTSVIKIENFQSIYYDLKKEWEVKNFFKRLFKFNWKKKETIYFWIDNSNKEIKIKDTRIININE